MKKIKIIFLLLIVTIFSCENETKIVKEETPVLPSEEIELKESTVLESNIGFLSKEKPIIQNLFHDDFFDGFWNSGFPVSSGLSGYYFSKTGFFIYFDYNDILNIKSRYSGSLGLWFIENEIINIAISYNFYWANDYIETPFGYTVKKDNYLKTIDGDKNWEVIGDKKELESVEGVPDHMKMNRIQNSKILNEPIELFHVYTNKNINLDFIELEKMDPVELFTTVFAEINS